MPYVPGQIGGGEARLLALQSLVQSHITDLTAVFGIDSNSSFLLDSRFGTPSPSWVVLGDVMAAWTEPNGSLRIAISAGDHENGVDYQSERLFIDLGNVRKVTFQTTIYAYFHHTAFRVADDALQQQRIAICAARLLDWMRAAIFNTGAASNITLVSQELQEQGSPLYDSLTNCMVKMGRKGIFARSFGDQLSMYGVHLSHTGQLF